MAARLSASWFVASFLLWTVARGQIQFDPGNPQGISPRLYPPEYVFVDEDPDNDPDPVVLEMREKCKEKLNATGDVQIDLFQYVTMFKSFVPFVVVETTAPNTDPFKEDCNSISLDGSGVGSGVDDVSLDSGESRSVIFINSSQTCHDVLFFVDEVDPVVCLYYPTPSTAQFYFPQNSEEEKIEDMCIEDLERPRGNLASLLQYDSQPDNGALPGYFLFYTTLENNDTLVDDDCFAAVQYFTPDESEGRPVIWIYESGTCSDVLFFVNDSNNTEPNPVVCLYYPPLPTNFVIVIYEGLLISTYLMGSISIIASLIILITHLIFPSLRTLPSKVIMNLALSFLLGDIAIIINVATLQHSTESTNPDVVNSITIVSFYFFYARWVWMALSGFEMCRTIHVGTQLRFDSEKKRLRILLTYILTGWTLPLIPTIIMTIVHFEGYEKDDGRRSLFGIGGLVISLAPVALVILVNIGIVAYLTYVLLQARKWQIKVSEAISSHRRKTNFTRIFIIILSVLGLTWFLLFLVFIDGINRKRWVQVLYTVFNSLQPIFVCVAFIGTKKILRKYMSLFSPATSDDSEVSTIQNRFRNRRLLSFLFTDKELSESLPKYRFGRSNRNNSKASVTSISMLSRDSSNSIKVPPPSTNGAYSPPKEDLGLTPISEELEPDEKVDDDSPTHITVDLKDSSM